MIWRKRELVLVFSLLGGDSFWRIDERRAVGDISWLMLLREKSLPQFDWLRAVVFHLDLKYLHVKITNLLRIVV